MKYVHQAPGVAMQPILTLVLEQLTSSGMSTMTNGSKQCPGDMEEVTLSVKRLCGRSYNADRSCVSADFSTNSLQYSQVCGRITEYGAGDVFHWYLSYLNRVLVCGWCQCDTWPSRK